LKKGLILYVVLFFEIELVQISLALKKHGKIQART